MYDIIKKVLPFVPAAFVSDPLFQKPTVEMEVEALKIKRLCRQRTYAKVSKKRKKPTSEVEDEEKYAAV